MDQHSFCLLKHLFIFKEILVDRTGRTRGNTGPTSLAENLVDTRLSLHRIEGNRAVRTHWDTRLAARAMLFEDMCRVRIEFDLAGVDERHHFGGSGASLGDRVRDVLWPLARSCYKHTIRKGANRSQFWVALEEPPFARAT